MEYKFEETSHKMSGQTKEYPAPSQSNPHWHENLEICQVLKNKCRFLIDGAFIDAEEGDLVVIPENTVHQFQILEDMAIRIIHIHPTAFIQLGIHCKSLKKHITKSEIKKINGLEEKVYPLLQWLEEETTTEEKPDDNLVLQYSVLTLYVLLLRHFTSREKSSVFNKNREDFYKAVEYINLHYAENINIKILSEKLYISREKLSTVFKHYSGMNLNDYIYQLRLKKANYMLENGSKIVEAALESGFQNIRTFNKIYREWFQISPSEYLSKIRKTPSA